MQPGLYHHDRLSTDLFIVNSPILFGWISTLILPTAPLSQLFGIRGSVIKTSDIGSYGGERGRGWWPPKVTVS